MMYVIHLPIFFGGKHNKEQNNYVHYKVWDEITYGWVISSHTLLAMCLLVYNY